MSKLPRYTMSLKQFLMRQEVLALYKDIFRALKRVPDPKTKKELKDWARTDFRKNMHQTDDLTIKSLVREGQRNLTELQRNLAMSNSETVKQVSGNQN